MTKKRFQKLTRAYFTRLNEWGKQNGYEPMPMGKVYKSLDKLAPQEIGMTRSEWWEMLSKSSECTKVFGVGIKTK